MELLLTAAWTAFFLFLISTLRFFETVVSRRWIQGVFLLKIASGVALWFIYTYYYKDRENADIYKYFDDSRPIFDALFTKPLDYLKMVSGIGIDASLDKYFDQMSNWYRLYNQNLYNDNQTIIRFNAIVRLFSMGYYQVHSVFMGFLSLSGLVAIFKTFAPYFKNKRSALFFCVFLLPSVLFWGSGVLKEGLVLLGLGLLIYATDRILKKERLLFYLPLFAGSFALLLVVKMYVLMSILPGLTAVFMVAFSSFKKPLLMHTIALLLFFTGLSCAKYIQPTLDPLEMLANKQHNFIMLGEERMIVFRAHTSYLVKPKQMACIIPTADSNLIHLQTGCRIRLYNLKRQTEGSVFTNPSDTLLYKVNLHTIPPRSFFKLSPLQATPLSFLSLIPEALANTLFRPYPWESLSAISLLAIVENLLILSLFVLAVFFFKKPSTDLAWLGLCFSCSLILFLLIGWTTPVTGAIVRYKVPALPLLCIGLLFLIDEEKLLIRLPFLKKLIS